MTTQRDLDIAAEVSLKICEKCGWYTLLNHAEKCNPKNGQVATRLIESVPDIRAGKLGYGDGHVIFDLTDDFHVVFDNARCGKFQLQSVHLIDNLTVDESAALIKVLKGWLDDTTSRRNSGIE